MKIYSFCITDDQTEAAPPQGYVRASDLSDAFALIGDSRTNLYELPTDIEWPGELGASVCWERRERGRP